MKAVAQCAGSLATPTRIHLELKTPEIRNLVMKIDESKIIKVET
jgi:hypothetical protein